MNWENIDPIFLKTCQYFISTLVICLILFFVSNRDWMKTDKRFIVKKGIDCIVSIFIYSYIVIMIHFYEYIPSKNTISFSELIPYFAVALFMLGSVITQFVIFSKVNEKNLKKATFAAVIISLIVKMLMAFSSINYLIYTLNPSFYIIPEGLNFVEIGFEFVYYTFNLMITYGGTSIDAVGIISKIVQMSEIIIVYIFVGIYFSGLLGKLKLVSED